MISGLATSHRINRAIRVSLSAARALVGPECRDCNHPPPRRMKVFSSLISGEEATTPTLAATSWDSLSTTWRRFPTTSHNTPATVVSRKGLVTLPTRQLHTSSRPPRTSILAVRTRGDSRCPWFRLLCLGQHDRKARSQGLGVGM
ncbi:hypothetical protein HMPREF9577_01922 [Cutibacterium acnes HL110PA3]|nr:hypothetical protein HMPREF9577_01922 [Cutibacterium acnes HL110PA3]